MYYNVSLSVFLIDLTMQKEDQRGGVINLPKHLFILGLPKCIAGTDK